MNKKGISTLLILVVIVAVVVVGVVAYWAITSGGNTNGNGEETPNIAGATSLQFSVSATIEGVEEEYTFMAKNLGTTNVMLRVEQTDAEGVEFVYIMNQAEQTAWVSYAGEWMDVSSDFATYWDSTWSPALSSYKTALGSWSGTGDYQYTVEGNSYRVYDILVNPSLADSLFQHS
jgi:hypothetical protein